MTIKKTTKTLLLATALVWMVWLVAGGVITYFLAKPVIPYLLGLIIGGLGAAGLIQSMAITADKAVGREPATAQKISLRHFFLRSLIMISLLLLGIFIDKISVVGVFLALFSIKLGAYLFPFVQKRMEGRRERDVD